MKEIIHLCDNIRYRKLKNGDWYVWNRDNSNHNPEYPWCYCYLKYNKVFPNQKTEEELNNIQRKLKLGRLLKF